MARAVYIDVSATAIDGKRKRKLHYVYDGERVYKLDKLIKLKGVSEVFVDSLFPENYSEILELLRKGVRIHLLKNTRILKRLRLENNLRKNDEVDAMLISQVSRECFRELTIEEMELKVAVRPLISRYEWIVEKRKVLKQWKSRGFDYFREAIKAMESDRKRIGKEIIKIVNRSIYKDIYRRVCNELKVKDSVEIAILVLELPSTSGIDKLKSYLGLTLTKKNDKCYNHRLRRHLESLAVNLYFKCYEKKNIPEEFINVIKTTPSKGKILQKLQLKILKILRRAFIEVNIQKTLPTTSVSLLADEQ